ncbi:MAG: phosphatidylinositol kinase [Gammaproteobacteria bacterium]
MDRMYRIIEVPPDAADSTEQLGSKPKFWFVDSSGKSFLFKEGRSSTGENWAEKVSAEICVLLKIPHASYELAVWRGTQGVISENFVPRGARLIFGNELLARVVSDYERETSYYRQSGHTVIRVFAVLRDAGIQVPTTWQGAAGINTASDVFAGYLMLDALIGNTDRHHENWGLVSHAGSERQEVWLAPTFDHASSLGRNETDVRRAARLASKDPAYSVAGYAERARSALYRASTDPRPLSTLDAFREAAKLRPRAAQSWVRRLQAIDDAQVRSIVDEVPPAFMNAPAREFVYHLLLTNKARITQMTSEP